MSPCHKQVIITLGIYFSLYLPHQVFLVIHYRSTTHTHLLKVSKGMSICIDLYAPGTRINNVQQANQSLQVLCQCEVVFYLHITKCQI